MAADFGCLETRPVLSDLFNRLRLRRGLCRTPRLGSGEPMVVKRFAVVVATTFVIWVGVEPASRQIFPTVGRRVYGELIRMFVSSRPSETASPAIWWMDRGTARGPPIQETPEGIGPAALVFNRLPSGMRLALWLNIYNFLVISLVVDHSRFEGTCWKSGWPKKTRLASARGRGGGQNPFAAWDRSGDSAIRVQGPAGSISRSPKGW